MIRSILKKVFALAVMGTMLPAILTGCGSTPEASVGEDKPAEETTEVAEKEPATGDVKKIKLGIGNAAAPWCYLDENEKEAGYDYDVLLLVQEKLEDKYEFEFIPDAVQNLIVGLDTGAYDMVVHHWGYNKERAEKYLYAEEGDFYINFFVVGYPEGTTDITDLESCAGKTAVTMSGIMSDIILQNWNAEHPDKQIEIAYVDNEEAIATGIRNGLYDFYVVSQYDITVFNDHFDNLLICSESKDDWIKSDNPGIFFLYSKEQQELQEDIDKALVELREDGTLSKMCIERFGQDFSSPELASE